MIDPVSLSMVRDLVAIFGVVAGFSYYVLTVRNAQNNQKLTLRNQEISLRNQEETLRTRAATIYHQMMAPIISTEWGIKRVRLLSNTPFSNHEEWLELYRSNPEYAEAWSWVINIYEMIGAYLRSGLVIIEFFILHNIFWHLRFWRQAKPIIHKQRERLGLGYFRNMEYLFECTEKYLEEHPELAPQPHSLFFTSS